MNRAPTREVAMPVVEFEGQKITCAPGTRLRDVLHEAGLTPHNGPSRWLNCRGLGTCGTCAVSIVEGEAGERNARERWRLDFPPHQAERGLRLACQVRVTGDLVIEKHAGFWGQHVRLGEDGARGTRHEG